MKTKFKLDDVIKCPYAVVAQVYIVVCVNISYNNDGSYFGHYYHLNDLEGKDPYIILAQPSEDNYVNVNRDYPEYFL
jgi:hypothetical protein